MLYRRLFALFTLIGLLPGMAIAAVQHFDYPGARLIHESDKQDAWYILALGSITRTQGQWQPEVTERFRGSLRRASYELPYGHTPEEAHQSYLNALDEQSPRVLFDCSGRGCGGSNYWANRIFEVKELYGPDENQRYTALEINKDDKTIVAAVYSIQRGNRRSYLHIDWLEQKKASSQANISASDSLQSGQPVSLTFSPKGWNKETLNSVASLMNRVKDIQLYVVGHAYEGAELGVMREKARVYAQDVSRLLQQRGVEADRLIVFGLGPLAPGLKPVDRVVLIRH